MWRGLVIGTLGMLAGCDGCRAHPATSDATEIDDDAADAVMIDVLDAAPDARPDAPPDAAVPYVSPACTSTPMMLIDVTPRQIVNMAVTGHVLYLAAQEVDTGTGTVSNAAVLSIDLTTGLPLDPPFAVGRAEVWAAGGEVYASDVSDPGTIWHMHPGAAPTAVVTNRPYPGTMTTDGTYVYWSEAIGQALIQRQPLAGGAVETVIASCPSARNLIATGDLLYCASFQNGPMYAPKDGSAPATTVAGYTTAYPVITLVQTSANLYFANLYNNPQLWEIPLPTGPMVKVQQSTTLGRYVGLAVSPEYLYAIDWNLGIVRVRLGTYDTTLIHGSVLDGLDPVLWNGQLYYAEQNPQTSGYRYVMHCID